jgi:glycosyltransferase involved in cell wall biosynthesis
MSFSTVAGQRVRAAGKFFRVSGQKFFVKGLSYGPFAPNENGEPLPDRAQVREDFAHIRRLGANTIRVYFPPPLWLLDEALKYGLYVFVDIPWEKHRCFFEDWESMERARNRVRTTARELGDHPAIFAISVVNEFPVDVVRFQGRGRVERFVQELIGIVKEESPECLVTFVNYPTTEFLEVNGCDFTCFNVYLHDETKFGVYLDRLQHIAGNQPLVLGEYGIDSQREGDVEQAAILTRHLRQVFRHGLAGSVIFAYTDDWFTGGHQIDDWFFGVTRADRADKLAATALQNVWTRLPLEADREADMPKVSVVVCTYNGGKTLRGCLDSLMELDYPDYEVIVVNDGSNDNTAEICAEFPQVVYQHQRNQGLSVARNVGAGLAGGEIVAYTDDDCVADEHWLRYLVQAMRDQQVEAIGGPNLTPESDGWIARCVAASPGNPSHVMLDDTHAEHIPGCNMAFRRSTLLGIGGFDPQFRVAGDDVDICWRMLDANLPIGYAPGAMVWHHRRATLSAYAGQQKGYGRSEALVHFKHPQRFGTYGRSRWNGIIYGQGAVGLPLMPDRIYHGQFGFGPFQTIYRHNHYGAWSVVMSLEWHLTAAFLLLLSLLFPPLAVVSVTMWVLTVGLAIRSAFHAPLPREAPWWARPVVAYLYLMQPIWRGRYRLTHLLRNRVLPAVASPAQKDRPEVKRISATERDVYWGSHQNLGRESLLETLVAEAKRLQWSGDFDNGWSDWDIKFVGDRWHDITCRTASENLGWPDRFTRLRSELRPTQFHRVAITAALIWTLAGVVSGQIWAMSVGAFLCTLILIRINRSRRRCLKAITRLVIHAGRLAKLQEAGVDGEKDSEVSGLVDSEPPSPSPATVTEHRDPAELSAGEVYSPQSKVDVDTR